MRTPINRAFYRISLCWLTGPSVAAPGLSIHFPRGFAHKYNGKRARAPPPPSHTEESGAGPCRAARSLETKRRQPLPALHARPSSLFCDPAAGGSLPARVCQGGGRRVFLFRARISGNRVYAWAESSHDLLLAVRRCISGMIDMWGMFARGQGHRCMAAPS